MQAPQGHLAASRKDSRPQAILKFLFLGSLMELRTTCHLSIEPATDVIEVKNEIQKKDENEDEDMSKKVEYHVLNATAITRNNM